MRLRSLLSRGFLATLVLLAVPASRAQQASSPRFDLYAGFSDLNTPHLNNLNQVGFHLQGGMNASRWFAYGLDYSSQHGSSTITPGLVTPTLRLELGGVLPSGYQLVIPYDATVQSLSGGGQFVIRRNPHVTFFVRPVVAAFHIRATTHPGDVISTLIAEQIAPGGTLTEWYAGYGAGGGVELPISRHFGARAQIDAAWNHPFSNIFADGSWSYRYSVGPTFHFGQQRERLK